MIRIILFDVDNTLMDFDACARAAVEAAFQKGGLPYHDGVYPAFDRINEGLWRQIERGELTRAEHARIRWQRIFDELGIEADGPAFEPVFKSCLCETGVPMPGARELLNDLKGRYTLCVASNAPYQQQVSRLRNAGMLEYFDHLFISERIGFLKPDPRFFAACLSELQKPHKDEVLLVGDSLTADIAGGEAFGIQTCWFDPKGLPCPETAHPTYVIRALTELQTIL